MAVNLFSSLGRPDEQLHPHFLTLRDHKGYASAKALLEELQASFDDIDGNFVEQFQTTGFDSRTFELFLYALFQSAGHQIDRSHSRPDFLLSKGSSSVAVEAVTANPTATGRGIRPYQAIPKSADGDPLAHLRHDAAIRLGSPLFSKLKQKYWELPHVAGKPLVLAIQDFHEDGSLSQSSAALIQYLYGSQQHWYHDSDGKLIISEHAIHEHRKGLKTIPSGFFKQPDGRNISAVLFTNSGTIAKFNRIGHEGSYRNPTVRMLRHGLCQDFDPNATMPENFLYEVGNPENDPESWGEGTTLIFNPDAAYPLSQGWLGATAEVEWRDGEIITTMYEPFFPLTSLTQIYPSDMSTQDFHAQAVQIMETRLLAMKLSVPKLASLGKGIR